MAYFFTILSIAAPYPDEGRFTPSSGEGVRFTHPIPLFLKALNFIFLHFTVFFFKPAAKLEITQSTLQSLHQNNTRKIPTTNSTNLHSLAVSTVKVSCACLTQERPTDNRKTNNSGYI